jgi:hypothetical protein
MSHEKKGLSQTEIELIKTRLDQCLLAMKYADETDAEKDLKQRLEAIRGELENWRK